MERRCPLVSIVVPLLDEQACLPVLYRELTTTCDLLPFDFEFLFVDDGSSDQTPDLLARLAAADPRVRVLTLSRNFGHQAALCAGLEHATGEAVITMDGDLQHPPRLLPDLLERWLDGYDVVSTCRVTAAGAGPIKR